MRSQKAIFQTMVFNGILFPVPGSVGNYFFFISLSRKDIYRNQPQSHSSHYYMVDMVDASLFDNKREEAASYFLFHLILFQVIVGTKQDVDRVDLPYEEIEATVTF